MAKILTIIERSNGERWICGESSSKMVHINSQIQGLDVDGMIERESTREISEGSLRRWFETNKDIPIVEDYRKSGASDDDIGTPWKTRSNRR